MAGHSHWAGIKHKKGKADKQRSKIFSKLFILFETSLTTELLSSTKMFTPLKNASIEHLELMVISLETSFRSCLRSTFSP